MVSLTQAEVQRLQQLAMGAVALVERMQEQQGLLGGAEGQRGQQLHVVQEAPRDEKFTGGVSSRSAASDGEEANAGVERQQPDHGVGAPGSGTTTVVDGSPAPATEPVRESHDSGEEGYKAPATDPGGAVASQSSDTSRMESLYRELLHAVADRTTLENHAQTIQVYNTCPCGEVLSFSTVHPVHALCYLKPSCALTCQVVLNKVQGELGLQQVMHPLVCVPSTHVSRN